MYAPTRNRTASALAALGIVAGGFAALLAGLAAQMTPAARRDALAVLTLVPPAPIPSPPPEARAKAHSTAAKGRPAPAALRNKAAPIVAPPAPLPPLIVPPPIATATKAGTGSANTNGASDRPGPGQGAGGVGSGNGGGGNGSGDGDDDTDAVTRPRQIKGRLHFSDLPADLQKTHAGGELELQYRIGIDGRVSDCRIRKSSGRVDLDSTTCRLITERFRFKPSRDQDGDPVPSIMIETHGWYFPPGDDAGVP